MTYQPKGLKFYAHRAWSRHSQIEIACTRVDGQKEYRLQLGKIPYQERKEEEEFTTDETVHITVEEARSLYDTLGSVLGLPQQDYLNGVVEAQKKHLEDLRLLLTRVQL